MSRPGQALRVPGVWGSQISRQFAHEGGKVCSTGTFYPQEIFLVLMSLSVFWAGSKQDNSAAPSEIEPATFRLVAQCLIQMHHRVPQEKW